MARISTTDLVNKIFMFCEAYSGVKFFPYQVQLSKRFIRSVITNDGDEITALQARQSGKSEVISTTTGGMGIILPVLANMPMFAGDKRIEPFREGLLVGIFAPALQQSQITFNRIKKRMFSKHAQNIMQEPDINVSFDTNNGQNIALSNGTVITTMSASEGSNIEGMSYHLIIVDEAQDVGDFKYSKSISPMGAFYNATKILIGTPSNVKGFFYSAIERNKKEHKAGKRRNHFEYNWEVVVKYNPKYAKYIEGEKARLGEESDEFQMSYNLKWILERGMFITYEALINKGNPELGLIHSGFKKSYVIGIDLAKSNDSTVITVVEVDFDNPLIVEKSTAFNVPDYITHKIKVVNWIEIHGDNWEEYYPQIIDVINNYNTVRVVIDATAVGSPIADRINANVRCEVVPYVFGKSSKSTLYKHYSSELKSGRIEYPASPDVVDTREYKKFIRQHTELQKSYSGQFMVVSHPPEKDAHDDYPDSLALAVWGARGEEVERPVTEKNNPYNKIRGDKKVFFRGRNRFTATRR